LPPVMGYTLYRFVEKCYEEYQVSLILVLAGIFVTCLLLVFLGARRRERHDRDSRAAARNSGMRSPIKAVHLLKPHSDSEGNDPEVEAVLRLYPILKGIPYAHIPEGVGPGSPDTLDEATKKMIGERISSFGPLRVNSGRLLNLLRDPESNPGEITTIVSTNPVFSAKLLQAVNSVYFNLPDRITSVGRAITLLGYNNVRSLVLQDTLNRMIPGDHAPSDSYSTIWTHSAIVSACSGYFGKKAFGFSEYEMATIGLLHDIGKYYMGGDTPGETPDLSVPLPLREECAYGFNHAVLGSLVAESWRLPPIVSRAIAYHHHPSFLPPESIPEDCLKQSFLICLSDLVARLLEYDNTKGEILPIRLEYFINFEIRKNLAALITPLLIKEAHKARTIVESYGSLAPE
jgi:HD-like signal output (HDOD) protein